MDVVPGWLEVGARAYGDGSFDLPAGRFAVEIEQEMLDVMGWGSILWSRVQALKGKLEALEVAARQRGHGSGPLEPLGGNWRNVSAQEAQDAAR